MKILTNPCVENRFQFLSYFSPFLDRFERYYPIFGKEAPSFNLLFHTSIVLFRIRNILLKIFPSKLSFLLPAATIAFLISKWRIEKTRTATFPSIFTCPRYVRPSWPVPLKNDIYISSPIPAESLCSMHIHPGHETGFSLAPRKLPRQKAGQNFFPLMKERSSPLLCSDARPVYAIFLPLDSKLPHLPRPRSSFDRFIGFSLLSIYIYVLYIYYIPVMKISCDVSGDAAVSSRTGMITGANTVGLPPLTRGCGGWGEEGPFARKGEKGREGETLINFI